MRREEWRGRCVYSQERDESLSRNWRSDRISSRAYNLIIGVVLLWGFIVNALMCEFATDFFMTLNPIAVIIGYFVVAIAGVWMSASSENPIISFIGYNLVVLPVGVVLSICLTQYETVSILNACIVTAGVTAIMVVLSAIKPKIFLSMGKTLFFCLLGVVIIEGIALLFGIYMPTIWDILVAILFCGYIGYDWAKAQEKIPTVDNAVDSCVDLYLDIMNLFVRILAASGKKSSSSK